MGEGGRPGAGAGGRIEDDYVSRRLVASDLVMNR